MLEGTVTISKEEYFELRVAGEQLARLQTGGVDSWEWYGESLNPEGGLSLCDAKNAIKDEIENK